MNKIVKVKGINIGAGGPKICVPMVGKSLSELRSEAEHLRTLAIDLVEWRVDFFEDVENIQSVIKALEEIRTIITEIPLIFTFRSAKEGGEKEVSRAYYVQLNNAILETGLADLIDVELFHDEKDIKFLIEEAHNRGVLVIVSNHDFAKTPPKQEIISRLLKARELGGDLPKIAVMPNSPRDVLTLLDATLTWKEQYGDWPVITMSMGRLGVVSRLSGEIFGSALTFGAAKKASAPGQIAVEELRRFLSLIHSNLFNEE